MVGKKTKKGRKKSRREEGKCLVLKQASAVLALGRLNGSSLHGGLINLGSTGVS